MGEASLTCATCSWQSVKLRDGKPITDMKLGLVERFALKEALKKVRGTDIEKVLKEFEAI